MTGQWINAANVVKLIPSGNIDTKDINKVVASLAGRQIVGVVRSCPKVISLFQYAIANDSREAWNLLCMLYRHTAFTEALSVLPADEADDVAQNAMLTLWRLRLGLKPDLNLGGWVRVVAKNAATDVIRSRKPTVGTEAVIEETEDGDLSLTLPFVIEEEDDRRDTTETWQTYEAMDLASPEEMLMAEQMLEALVLARETLPPVTKRVLDLVDQGVPYEDVAELVGITPDAVRQQISRANSYMQDVVTYDKSD